MDGEIPVPWLVYMSLNVSQLLSFATWTFSKDLKIVLVPVPEWIFKAESEGNSTVFDKLGPAFQKRVQVK